MKMLAWFFASSDAAVTLKVNPYENLPLLSKGLVTTGMGLFGVFLVLALFFATIKLMQRIKERDSGN